MTSTSYPELIYSKDHSKPIHISCDSCIFLCSRQNNVKEKIYPLYKAQLKNSCHIMNYCYQSHEKKINLKDLLTGLK